MSGHLGMAQKQFGTSKALDRRTDEVPCLPKESALPASRQSNDDGVWAFPQGRTGWGDSRVDIETISTNQRRRRRRRRKRAVVEGVAWAPTEVIT